MLLSSYFPFQLLPMAPVLIKPARGLACSPRCLPLYWFWWPYPYGPLLYLWFLCRHGTVPWDRIRTTNNILQCCTYLWCLCHACCCSNQPLCILHVLCASNCHPSLSCFCVASSLALASLLWSGANYGFLLFQVSNFAPQAVGFALWSRTSVAEVYLYVHSALPCSCFLVFVSTIPLLVWVTCYRNSWSWTSSLSCWRCWWWCYWHVPFSWTCAALSYFALFAVLPLLLRLYFCCYLT